MGYRPRWDISICRLPALRRRGYNDTPAWSPDGKFLAYILRRPPTTLCILSVESGEERDLQPKMIFHWPLWTPDGRYVLFLKARRNLQGVPECELWRVDVKSSESRFLGLAMGWMRNISLHPDGRRIAFDSGQPKLELWVMENFLK